MKVQGAFNQKRFWVQVFCSKSFLARQFELSFQVQVALNQNEIYQTKFITLSSKVNVRKFKTIQGFRDIQTKS
jgi:hypothetical protein